jgi:hypothetical protein
MTTEQGVNDTADQPHVSRSRRLEGSERIGLRAETRLRPARPVRSPSVADGTGTRRLRHTRSPRGGGQPPPRTPDRDRGEGASQSRASAGPDFRSVHY